MKTKPACETAWETGPFAAARASLTGSGRFAEAASAAELAAPALALILSCSRSMCCLHRGLVPSSDRNACARLYVRWICQPVQAVNVEKQL